MGYGIECVDMLALGAWLFQLFLCFLLFRVWMRLKIVYFCFCATHSLVHIYSSQVMVFRQLERSYKSKYTFMELTSSFSLPILIRIKRYPFPLCVNMAYCILQTTNVQVVHLFNGSFKKSKPFFSAVQFCHVLYNFHSKSMYSIQYSKCALCIRKRLI